MAPSRKATSKTCSHTKLYVSGSPEASDVGFVRSTEKQRLGAATAAGRVTKTTPSQLATPENVFNDDSVFPGPLVLPDDELAMDPEDAPQSFKSWFQLTRNAGRLLSNRRKTLYVIPPPEQTDEVKSLMQGWDTPRVPKGQNAPGLPSGGLQAPTVEDLCDYLRAFYHPMEVKLFKPKYLWRPWIGSQKNSAGSPSYIGLEPASPSGDLVGIRYRPSPDGIAKQQLNLCDITDAMLEHVPSDAHTIVMLTHHDIYEDDDDDFCAGRAWGSSRVAIVSSFRYHPCLDHYAGINLSHMWPASHCKAYVDDLCQAAPTSHPQLPVISSTSGNINKRSPLALAVQAATPALVPKTTNDFYGLWMTRTARTVSHEVGHCVALDHCSYFACVMQATAGMSEDVRQPPYLCPVCLQKLSNFLAPLVAAGGSEGGSTAVAQAVQKQVVRGQHEALAELCRRWEHVGMMAGLGGWLGRRLEMMDEGEEDGVIDLTKDE